MLASAILARAGRQLQDAGATRWTTQILLDYLNEGRRQIVIALPHRFIGHDTVQLGPGAVQTLPADCPALFGMRNMGSDGATPGSVVRGPVDRSVLDALTPTWMDTTGYPVKEWAKDAQLSSRYYVHPAVPELQSVYVELEAAFYPADINAANDDIGMPNDLEGALLAWMLFRAFDEETEEGSDAAAERWYKKFSEALT